MNECPHCKNPSIKTWKKLNATKAFPVKCAQCKQLSFLPAWWHLGSVLSFEVLFWGSILIELSLRSYFPLFLFPSAILLFVIGGKKLSLIPTNQHKMSVERKKLFILLSAFILLVFLLNLI
jgi:hypothetical protein